MKEECYVFDFAPDRALRQIADYSYRINMNESNPARQIELTTPPYVLARADKVISEPLAAVAHAPNPLRKVHFAITLLELLVTIGANR